MSRTLTRPMFRKGGMAQRTNYMGGGIKTVRPKYMGGGMTGIMSGIRPDAGLTPRAGFKTGKTFAQLQKENRIKQEIRNKSPFLTPQEIENEYNRRLQALEDASLYGMGIEEGGPGTYLEKIETDLTTMQSPEGKEAFIADITKEEKAKEKELIDKGIIKPEDSIFKKKEIPKKPPSGGDPNMFFKNKKDEVPSDKETVKDYIDMFRSALGDEEDSERRNKYLALAQFGANLLAQPGGDLVGAVGKAGAPAIQTLGKAMSDKRDAERQAKLLGTQAYLKSIEPGALAKQINDLVKMGYTKQGAINKIVEEGRGTATRESTQVTKRENLAKELTEEGIPPRQAGVVAGKILASKIPDYRYTLLPEDPVVGEYYYTKDGKAGKYVIKDNKPGLDE